MAPQNIRAEAKSKSELLITWEPPSSEACNGILIGYHVGYLPMDDIQNSALSTTSNSRYTMKTININSQYGEDIVINGLVPYTIYSIVVQAFNSKGPGPFSKPITVQTDEGSKYAHYKYTLITYGYVFYTYCFPCSTSTDNATGETRVPIINIAKHTRIMGFTSTDGSKW